MEIIGQVHIVDLPGGVRVGWVQKLVRYAAYLQEGETALLTLVSEKLEFFLCLFARLERACVCASVDVYDENVIMG